MTTLVDCNCFWCNSEHLKKSKRMNPIGLDFSEDSTMPTTVVTEKGLCDSLRISSLEERG